MELGTIIKQPICIKCEYEWQKGYALALFEDCDNPYRVDDEDFMYVHFRTFKNFTFYSDDKGGSRKQRPIYKFEEIFKL